jgi:hypothetical protein
MAANEGDGGERRRAGPPIFQRLAGLGTEYAVRFRADDPEPGLGRNVKPRRRPPDHHLFNSLIAELRRVIPAAPGAYGKKGFFLANGGAVWHEKGRLRVDCALLEGSTPECRGPRQLLAQQRAQDELLSTAARDARAGGELTLCKSDRDAAGHAYGAQENYEVELAAGWRLRAWRAGIVLLMPAVVLAYVGIAALFVLILVYWLLAALLYRPVVTACEAMGRYVPMPERRTVHAWLFGPEFHDAWRGEGFAACLPAWLESVLYWGAQLASSPAALGLTLRGRLTAVTKVRRELLPFLVSRAVFGGSGRLTRGGSYHVASKATAVNCVASVNEIFARRPVYSFGHLLKSLMMPTGRAPLRSERQRLQINLGDSNLCEEAEYLRVGTTMLVIDVIEAGAMPPGLPRLWRPVGALRRIASDSSLRARVRAVGGRRWTALEIQRFYLDACRTFLAGRGTDAPPEAHDVVRRWADVLDRLEHAPGELFGRVDWVTKRRLLDEAAGEDAPWPVRKKIDLRYHELSSEGYFRQLQEAGLTSRVLSDAELDRARRTPPPDSPATERGRYIREFAESTTVKASWETVRIGDGQTAKTIHLRPPVGTSAAVKTGEGNRPSR